MNQYCPFCKNPDVKYKLETYSLDAISSFETKIICPVCKVKFSFLYGAYDEKRLEDYKTETFARWNKRKPCDMNSEDLTTYCECCKLRISLMQGAETTQTEQVSEKAKKRTTAEDMLFGDVVSDKDKVAIKKVKRLMGGRKGLDKLFGDF